MEKKYILHNVYNTLTGEYEDVEVSEELYVTYKRTGWGIENNDASFYDHEIQLSGLIGGENDNYENFREFVDNENTPESIVIDNEMLERLYDALDYLQDSHAALIHALYFEGLSETEYAKRIGVSIAYVCKLNKKILQKIKKTLQ